MLKLMLLTFSLTLTASNFVDYDLWFSVDIYHALNEADPNLFTVRGNITVEQGNSQIVQQPLTSEERKTLQNLAKTNDFYRLKAVLRDQTGRTTDFLTSTRACGLLTSHLQDNIWLTLDHAGTAIAVSQSLTGTSNVDCSDLRDTDFENVKKFNTYIFLKHMELGPIPDTASFIQKIEREREARDRGEVKDNRGFFAKYWMYIVPVAILLLISGATNPDAGASGGR